MIPNEIEETEYPRIFEDLLEQELPEMSYKKAFVILARREERDQRFSKACFELFSRSNFSFLNDENSPFHEIFFQTLLYLNNRTKEEELAGEFSESGYYKAMLARARKNILADKKSETNYENFQSGLNQNQTHRETNPNGTEPMGSSAL